jgi:hypothetical protein
MPPRPLNAALEDAANRREPSLTDRSPGASPRLVTPRTGAPSASTSPFALRAGERVVVSSVPAGTRGNSLKIAGVAVLGVLALVGVAALVRTFVGL